MRLVMAASIRVWFVMSKLTVTMIQMNMNAVSSVISFHHWLNPTNAHTSVKNAYHLRTLQLKVVNCAQNVSLHLYVVKYIKT